jgi:PAS domain S-box-containing protein
MENACRTEKARSGYSWELLDAFPESAFLLELDGLIVALNAKAAERLGALPHELVGQIVWDLFPEDVSANGRKNVEAVAVSKLSEKISCRWDGRIYGFEFLPVQNAQAGVERIAFFIRDILDSKEIENALRDQDSNGRSREIPLGGQDVAEQRSAEESLIQEKEFSDQLIRTANAIIVCMDSQGTILLFNEAAERITGYTQDEVLGKNWYDLLVPRDRYPWVWVSFTFGTELIPLELENPILTKSGEERIISFRNSSLLKNGKLVTISYGIDITENKRVEEELLLLSSAVEQAAAPIVISDADWRIIYVNPAFQRLSGYSAKEVIGNRTLILNPEEQGLPEDAWAEIKRRIAMRLPWTGKLDKITKEGKPFTVEATIAAIRNDLGSIVSYFDFWRDISHEEDLQKQLVQSRKMETIGTLAGGIAHDFNNILA